MPYRKITHFCAYCGGEFIARPATRYCSLSCAGKLSQKKDMSDRYRPCDYCNTPYLSRPWVMQHGAGRFCCHECSVLDRKRPLDVRFWEKVDKNGPLIIETNCWVWTANKTKYGYGHMKTSGQKEFITSRISWNLHFGDIPKDLHVLHKCDNPPCVRPEHLFTGTPADNMADKVSKGRQLKGSECWQSKLTELDVINIKSRLSNGETRYRIAKDYKVDWGQIDKIMRNFHWKHIL